METRPLQAGMHEFENDYLHLMVDEQARLLYSEWVRKPTREEYREAITVFAELLRSKDVAYWIKDTSRLCEVNDEELRWVLYELLPVAVSSPLQKLARNFDTEDAALKLIGRNRPQPAKLAISSGTSPVQGTSARFPANKHTSVYSYPIFDTFEMKVPADCQIGGELLRGLSEGK